MNFPISVDFITISYLKQDRSLQKLVEFGNLVNTTQYIYYYMMNDRYKADENVRL